MKDVVIGDEIEVILGRSRGTVGTIVKIYKKYRSLAGGDVVTFDLKTNNGIVTDIASYLCKKVSKENALSDWLK